MPTASEYYYTVQAVLAMTYLDPNGLNADIRLMHDYNFENSGMGSYHGQEGFRTLSHGKAVLKRQRWFPTQLFYPPYGRWVQRLAIHFYLGK